MTDLDKLIEAVEAGKYHREDGLARYFGFAEDSGGIIDLPRIERAELLRGGRGKAVANLRALKAQGGDA